MIEHPVDHNAGDRHVKPDGKSPPCNSFVEGKSLPPGAVERDEGQRNNGGRQNGMCSQKGEIEGSDSSMTLKVNNPAEEMVGEVKNQKNR